jgi:hypothetical protein
MEDKPLDVDEEASAFGHCYSDRVEIAEEIGLVLEAYEEGDNILVS